jgi:hypothetical protein
MVTPAEIAATNNAHWCDLVARTHGVAGEFHRDSWTSPVRTPPLYPDAVTLVRVPDEAELLSRIDGSVGCSVKDSFAAIDLAPDAFRVLFDAQWIWKPPLPEPSRSAPPHWTRVTDPENLTRWEEAWRDTDGPQGVFLPALLDDERVAVLAQRKDDSIVAGAILFRSDAAVGITNLFTREPKVADTWPVCIDSAARLAPGLPIVGYESGPDLQIALSHGFEVVGPLRVWIKDGR